MSIYRRGKYFWMRFTFEGKPIQRSTRLQRRRDAENHEADFRTKLIKEGTGLMERRSIPTFREFSERFMEEIALRCAEKPRTVQFYAQQLDRLLDFQMLANARLQAIDESLISLFVQQRSKQVSPATVNRALATLRRGLRLAQEWRMINRVPRIRLLKGEHSREFVLSHQQEQIYLAGCLQPLHDVALLILDTGLRLGEALRLEWPDIHSQPIEGARYGYLFVREGKSRYAKRALPLTARVQSMLHTRRESTNDSLCVFRSKDNPSRPYAGTSLDHTHREVRERLCLPNEFVIHSLRHTMLTRLGDAGADAFTIMRIAGHSSVTVSQRYVHPSKQNLELAFERLELLNERAFQRHQASVSLLPQDPASVPRL